MSRPVITPIEWTRRAALGGLAAGAVGFALWPVRPRRAEAIPAGRTVLEYWEKWTGREGVAVQAAVDAFNESQDRIWVRRTPVTDIVAKAMVAIGGGDPPDVCGLFNYSIPRLASAGAVIPFGDLGPGPLDPGHYAPAVWRMLTHEGRQVAGVATCHATGMYLNAAHARSVGLDPDAPPATVDELDAWARQLTIAADDGRLERAGFMPNIPGWWPYAWSCLFDGRFVDENGRAGLASPANEQAFTWIASYPERYGRGAATAFATAFARSYLSAGDPFMAERLSIVLQGPWMANFIDRARPEMDYRCFPAPRTTSGRPPTGMLEADVLVIPRGVRHPEASLEFIRFMQTPAIQEQLARAHCKSSPLATVSADFARDHPNPFVDVFDAIVKSPDVQTAPRLPVWKAYADLIGSTFEAIWNGASVTVTLETGEARAQAMIDRMNRRAAMRRAT